MGIRMYVIASQMMMMMMMMMFAGDCVVLPKAPPLARPSFVRALRFFQVGVSLLCCAGRSLVGYRSCYAKLPWLGLGMMDGLATGHISVA